MMIGYIDREGNAYKYEISANKKGELSPAGRKILNSKAEIILNPDEVIIKQGSVDCDISTKWTNFWMDEIFGSGVGILYRTNKRLIFIREIKPYDKLKYGGFPGTAVVDALQAKEMKEIGAKEFFEVPLTEIVKYKKSSFSPVFLCLLVNGEKYHMGIGGNNLARINELLGQIVKIK